MNEEIRLGTENPSETQASFKGIAEKYKDPNNQQDTLAGFSNEIREKLNIKGSNYVPGYDFSQAIIEQTLRQEWVDRRGGLKKTSDGFLKFTEGMGINPQDPSVPLEKLAEEYLLRPYVTKVHPARPAPETTAAEVLASPNSVQEPRKELIPEPQPIEGEKLYDFLTRRIRAKPGEPADVVPTEEVTTEGPTGSAGPETPAQRESRIRRMLAGFSDFLAQPGEEATALRERLATADRETFETLRQAVVSLAGKVPDLFRRKPEEVAEVETTETPAQREGKIREILRGVNEFLAQPSDEAARLRAADQRASEELARSLGSLARKVPDLFRRGPQEETERKTVEARTAPAQPETPK